MSKMTYYVLGFAFSESKNEVVLVRKNHPYWQAGRLNGVFGKLEVDEDAIDAMVREFYEETVFDGSPAWNFFGRLLGTTGTVFLFRTFTDEIFNVGTMADEKVVIASSDDHLLFREHGVHTTPYLIPAAMDTTVTDLLVSF